MSEQMSFAETVEVLAAEMGEHSLARPDGEPVTWCVCLCWSVTRGSLSSDERAYEQHVAHAQAVRLTRAAATS